MSGEINPGLKEEVENQLDREFEWRELEDGLNTVYCLSGESKEYILKERTNPENKIEWFRAEPQIYKAIKDNTDVPSPEVIYQDFSTDSYENAFFVMEKMQGSNPQNMEEELTQSDLEEIISQYGRILGKLHNVKVSNKYGIQGFEDGEFISSEPNEKWSESIEGAMSSWQDIIHDKWENPPNIEYSSEKIKELLPEKPDPVIVHSDNRLDNILLKGTDITGFIDWSTSWTGHKHYDIVRAKYLLIEWDLSFWDQDFDEEKLEQKLIEGYSQETGFEENEKYLKTEKVYRYATTLWLAAGFANWGQNLGKEKHEEMRNEITQRIKKEEKNLQDTT